MSAHAEFLRAASKDVELATQLKNDFRTADLNEQDRRMLEFVEKLTLYPWLVTRSDVATLRSAKFPDSAILHIVLGCAHFCYLNRMADGIGIRFEYETQIPAVSETVPKPGSLEIAVPRLTDAGGAASAWIAFPESPELPQGWDGPVNLYRVMLPNPDARELAYEWRRYHLKATSELDSRLRAQLGLYISGLNHCEYSSYWLKQHLESLGEPHSCAVLLAAGEIPPELSAGERLLFEHGRRLTQEPANTREEHIHELRRAGLDDRGILQLTMLCSYLSFENRVALALGIPIETDA